jgi:hypothetical protein
MRAVPHKLTLVIFFLFCFAGAWTIHPLLIICLKIFYDIIPGVSQETSWTLTNITYMFGSYIMFHYVRGVPFEFNGGAYDNLNMWEQIDDGAQYTPAKKFLLSVPIVLFLLSTHYTHYDLAYFTINFLAVLAVIIPKLPFVSPPPSPVLLGPGPLLILSGRATACVSDCFRGFPRIKVWRECALGPVVETEVSLSSRYIATASIMRVRWSGYQRLAKHCTFLDEDGMSIGQAGDQTQVARPKDAGILAPEQASWCTEPPSEPRRASAEDETLRGGRPTPEAGGAL